MAKRAKDGRFEEFWLSPCNADRRNSRHSTAYKGAARVAWDAAMAIAIPELNVDAHANGFDYENRAWVIDGRYVSCGHPETMKCGCFGRIHAGESPAANAEIH